MSNITKLNPLPKEVEDWIFCRLLHEKRPVFTGERIWIEYANKWIDEIKWVCDICQAEEIN